MQRLWVVLASLVMAGCSLFGGTNNNNNNNADGGDDTGGNDVSEVKITSEGTGDPSVGPLSPTWAGIRREYSDGIVTTSLGPTQRWGKSVVRFQGSDDVRFFSNSDKGVLYEGTTRIGNLKTPILLVPPTVREGMQWKQIGTKGQTLGTFDVTKRGMVPTIFGTVPVWRVTQTNNVTMNVFYTDYAEGFGVVEADNRLLVAAVMPTQARAAKQSVTRTALTAAGDGMPVQKQFGADHASLVVTPGGATTLRVDGQMVWYMNTSGVGIWVGAPAVACATVTGGAVSGLMLEEFAGGGDGSAASCADANGATFDATGALLKIPVNSQGRAAGRVSGLFLDNDDVVRGIGRTTDAFNQQIWIRADTVNTSIPQVDGGSLDYPWLPFGTMGDAITTAITTTDAIPFVVRIGDRLVHSRSDSKNFSHMQLIGSVPDGHLSTRLDSTGRRQIFVSRDGNVDELTITDDTASLRRLAELDLPEGHELVSALPEGDGLLVLTLLGRENAAGGLGAEPKIGDLYVFRATIPTPPADLTAFEGPSHDDLNITAQVSGADVELCFRSPGAALTGWSLGKRAATAMSSRADNRCIVVIRDQTTTIDYTAMDAWLVEGNAPGVGPVVIATAPSIAQTQRSPIGTASKYPVAAISSGFTSFSLQYSAAGTATGVASTGESIASNTLLGGLADAGGYGVWRNNPYYYEDCGTAGEMCGELVRVGETVERTPFPKGVVINQIEGGGVLFSSTATAEYLLVKPDFSFTALPKLDDTASLYYSGARSNGLACGVRYMNNRTDQEAFCRDPDGTIRTKVLANPNQYSTVIAGMWPGPGGFYFALPDSDTILMNYFDPDTLDITPVMLPSGITAPTDRAEAVAWSATGELFVLGWGASESEPYGLFEIADGVATSVAVPKFPMGFSSATPPRFLIGPTHILLVGSYSPETAILRVPRP